MIDKIVKEYMMQINMNWHIGGFSCYLVSYSKEIYLEGISYMVPLSLYF